MLQRKILYHNKSLISVENYKLAILTSLVVSSIKDFQGVTDSLIVLKLSL